MGVGGVVEVAVVAAVVVVLIVVVSIQLCQQEAVTAASVNSGCSNLLPYLPVSVSIAYPRSTAGTEERRTVAYPRAFTMSQFIS